MGRTNTQRLFAQIPTPIIQCPIPNRMQVRTTLLMKLLVSCQLQSFTWCVPALSRLGVRVTNTRTWRVGPKTWLQALSPHLWRNLRYHRLGSITIKLFPLRMKRFSISSYQVMMTFRVRSRKQPESSSLNCLALRSYFVLHSLLSSRVTGTCKSEQRVAV